MAQSPDQEDIEIAREFARLTGQTSAQAVVAFYSELKNNGFDDETATDLTELFLMQLKVQE